MLQDGEFVPGVDGEWLRYKDLAETYNVDNKGKGYKLLAETYNDSVK